MSESYLIIGLGNPGERYSETRHNVGFEVIDSLSLKYNFNLTEKRKLFGYVGVASINGNKVAFLKPTTFMNLSGKAVKKCIDYYKIEVSNIFVIVDDVDIPLGEIRLKFNGGAGTHNGLKNIEQELDSKSYARLKIGIGIDKINNLEEFVLKKFSSSEKEIIKSMVKKSLDTIEIFFHEGFNKAANFANVRIKKHLGENK